MSVKPPERIPYIMYTACYISNCNNIHININHFTNAIFYQFRFHYSPVTVYTLVHLCPSHQFCTSKLIDVLSALYYTAMIRKRPRPVNLFFNYPL